LFFLVPTVLAKISTLRLTRLRTFDQVITALESDPEFRVIPGTRRDAVSFSLSQLHTISTGLYTDTR